MLLLLLRRDHHIGGAGTETTTKTGMTGGRKHIVVADFWRGLGLIYIICLC